LREDWIGGHVAATESGDRLATDDEVIEFNAETFRGESV
jgi:hypothetical protein